MDEEELRSVKINDGKRRGKGVWRETNIYENK